MQEPSWNFEAVVERDAEACVRPQFAPASLRPMPLACGNVQAHHAN